MYTLKPPNKHLSMDESLREDSDES